MFCIHLTKPKNGYYLRLVGQSYSALELRDFKPRQLFAYSYQQHSNRIYMANNVFQMVRIAKNTLNYVKKLAD